MPKMLVSLMVTAVVAAAGQSSSPAGQWTGLARIPGQAAIRIDVTIDSSAGKWTGTLAAPVQSAQPMSFASTTRTADSLFVILPAAGQNAVLRMRFASDGGSLSGTFIGPDTGSITLWRAGTPEASALLDGATRVEQSRIAANRLAETPPPLPATANPDSAKLVTSDIPLFWSAVDRAPADSLGLWLHREYLEKASFGAREFIPGRILSGEDLAAAVRGSRPRYDAVRSANLEIPKAETAIRAGFRRMKALYPEAVFPDVYFVVGRFNSGGTSTKHGLLIGAEMYPDPSALPGIVSHELIHFQQHYASPTLLQQSFKEGSADFIGELISGANINSERYRYGIAHEAELWAEFQKSLDARTFFPWMYGNPGNGRPNDLGYFIGYRIARAYYEKSADKTKAIRDIIRGDAEPGSIRRILAESGYNPR